MNGRHFALLLIALSIEVAIASCGGRSSTTHKQAASTAPAEKHWSYTGDTGPAAWGSLSAEDLDCAEGKTQSPVDISAAAAASAPSSLATLYGKASLGIDHQEHISDVLDNGHTIQVNCMGAESVTIEGKAYQLVQYHFHSPSEHTIDGRSFPMEMHLVHKSADGALAVIGALIQEGASDNAAFDSVWANLPTQPGQDIRFQDVRADVDHLLPPDRAFYRYDGSLTTPPCSEGVRWLVMKTPISLSRDQIAKFRGIIHDNNRPTQPLNGRVVALEKFARAS